MTVTVKMEEPSTGMEWAVLYQTPSSFAAMRNLPVQSTGTAMKEHSQIANSLTAKQLIMAVPSTGEQITAKW